MKKVYRLFAGVNHYFSVACAEKLLGEFPDDFGVIVCAAEDVDIRAIGRGREMAADAGGLDELEHRKSSKVSSGSAKSLHKARTITLHLDQVAEFYHIFL